MTLITVQEAASRLGISAKALYYAITEGKLTRHEQFGRVLLDEKEVSAYKPRAGAGSPLKPKNQGED